MAAVIFKRNEEKYSLVFVRENVGDAIFPHKDNIFF
jgi:hypothetical protein